MAQAHFEIKHEVPQKNEDEDWILYFQFGTYHYDDGRPDEDGFRFIWRHDGRLQARPARIPSKKDLEDLLKLATTEGWYK